MKTLVVGDIHGCFDELMDLLDKAGLSADDEVISLGDIVDRGPATAEVLDFFASSSRTQVLMGNHERKHVRSFQGLIEPSLSQRITRRQIGEARYPEAVEWMAGLPTSIELPSAVLVHAMFEPGVPLRAQRESVIVGTLTGEHYLKQHYAGHWYELYDGTLPLVVGHHNIGGGKSPYVRADGRVVGLDTSCYTGGALSGLLLPEFNILSVPSRANHWHAVKAMHADLHDDAPAIEDLAFDSIECSLATARGEHCAGPVKTQLAEMERVLARSEAAIEAILACLLAMHQQMLAGLQAEPGCDCADEKAFARAFSLAIPHAHLAPYLHTLRRGQLDAEGLKKRLQTPRAAFSMMKGLNSPS